MPATGYTYQPMAVGWPGQRMDAFVLTFPVKNRADVLTAHEGEELSFVLQGEILFQLGDEKIPLQGGRLPLLQRRDPAHGQERRARGRQGAHGGGAGPRART